MKTLLLIVAIPVILFVVIRFFEQKSLYYPFSAIEITPKDIGLDYEDVNITTEE